ncbi:MAG: TolC family protein [Chitinophagaceae bacterium]
MNAILKGLHDIVLLVLIVVTTCSENSYGQASPDTNSNQQLTEQDFLNIIRIYHPVVKQAGYAVQRAQSAITQAKGDFDPILSTDFERKRFDGSLYYSYYNPQLTIPTWYGIEIYAGAEEVSGGKVNSETTFGQSSYLGISIPLLKDLVLDKRRAVLQQARVYTRQAEAERMQQLNNLFFDGISSFWNWVRAYKNLQIINKSVIVNETRYRFVRIEFQQGNRPAIDTAEAMAQLQSFQLQQNEARLQFRNAAIELSNYLWLQNETPYLLPETIVPDTSWINKIAAQPIPLLDSVLLTARAQHPKLKVYDFKIDWLRIDQQLKFQSMLPKLDIKANLLNKGYNALAKVSTSFLENNYKYGIQFNMPLRLSEGRGAYRQAKLKVAEAGLAQKQEQWQIENKVKFYYNEVWALKEQVQLSEKIVSNYERLLSGEDTRFKIGESTLFLLNSRENKVLETQQKIIELKTKFYKNLAGLQWAAGQLR